MEYEGGSVSLGWFSLWVIIVTLLGSFILVIGSLIVWSRGGDPVPYLSLAFSSAAIGYTAIIDLELKNLRGIHGKD